MADPVIKIKRSAVAGKIPTINDIQLGEFAINTYDGKVYIEQDQSLVGVGTTVITINPWSVGTGTNTYNTYFTAGNVGIGSTLPISKLSVVGDGRFTGVVTATSFYGDGSQLTGISAGSQWVTTAAGIHTLSDVGIGTTNPTAAVTSSNTKKLSVGIVSAYKFYGDGSGLTGIVASGITTVQIRESAPLNPITGDLWYNSGLGRLFIYYTDDNSSQWVDVAPFNGTNSSGVTVSSLAPASPEEGDLWFSTIKGRLFIYYDDGDSSQWIDAAPFNQSEPSTIEFPTGDYGDLTSSTDAFGQATSGVIYDCLSYPSVSLATYDLGTI